MVVIALHILINFFIIASGVPDAGGTPHFRAFLKGLPVNNVFFELTAPNKNILTVTRLSGSATCSGYFYFNKYFLFLAAKNPCLDFYGRIFF